MSGKDPTSIASCSCEFKIWGLRLSSHRNVRETDAFIYRSNYLAKKGLLLTNIKILCRWGGRTDTSHIFGMIIWVLCRTVFNLYCFSSVDSFDKGLGLARTSTWKPLFDHLCWNVGERQLWSSTILLNLYRGFGVYLLYCIVVSLLLFSPSIEKPCICNMSLVTPASISSKTICGCVGK